MTQPGFARFEAGGTTPPSRSGSASPKHSDSSSRSTSPQTMPPGIRIPDFLIRSYGRVIQDRPHMLAALVVIHSRPPASIVVRRVGSSIGKSQSASGSKYGQPTGTGGATTISVIGSQEISGAPQIVTSARSQVRWSALKVSPRPSTPADAPATTSLIRVASVVMPLEVVRMARMRSARRTTVRACTSTFCERRSWPTDAVDRCGTP